MAVLAATVVAGCASPANESTSEPSPGATQTPRAAIIVSGVASDSPFTTPEQACRKGFPAGNSDPFLRQQLLDAGIAVYTVPERIGPGQVEEQSGPAGPYEDCPAPVDETLTLNTIATVPEGGQALQRFVSFLNTEYGVTELDVVAHSLGGPLSRAGIAAIQQSGIPVAVKSLTTIGGPWVTPMLTEPTNAKRPMSACDGLKPCRTFLGALLTQPNSQPLLEFMGPSNFPSWSEEQAGVLDDIPVTLIGGTFFKKAGGTPDKWPNDGAIQREASLAIPVSDEVIPWRRCHEYDDTHSLAVSELVGEPRDTALTWDPRVAKDVEAAIRSADTALQTPSRQGCPAPR